MHALKGNNYYLIIYFPDIFCNKMYSQNDTLGVKFK